MALVVNKHPYNLKATIENRINNLTTSIIILKDHIHKFGKKISDQDPQAYKFITNHLKAMEQELQIRSDFPMKSSI